MDIANDFPHLLLIIYRRIDLFFYTNVQIMKIQRKYQKKSKPVLYILFM